MAPSSRRASLSTSLPIRAASSGAPPAKKTLKRRITVHSSEGEEEEAPVKRRRASSAQSTPQPAQRQRKKLKTNVRAIPIPRSLEECTEPDKMLMEWREAGSAWADIRTQWQAITGEKTGTSTLPNRYKRLLDTFAYIRDEDKAKLIAAKQQIENKFESEKWSMVAKVMSEEMAAQENYDPVLLKRVHEKMMKAAEDLPAIRQSLQKNGDETGVGDEEGEGSISDDEEE